MGCGGSASLPSAPRLVAPNDPKLIAFLKELEKEEVLFGALIFFTRNVGSKEIYNQEEDRWVTSQVFTEDSESGVVLKTGLGSAGIESKVGRIHLLVELNAKKDNVNWVVSSDYRFTNLVQPFHVAASQTGRFRAADVVSVLQVKQSTLYGAGSHLLLADFGKELFDALREKVKENRA